MRVKWLDTALRELDIASEFIATDSVQRAVRFIESVFSSVERLTRCPALGRPGRISGTRELVDNGTPYIVAYRMRSDVVEILRVRHAKRKWPQRF